MSHKQQTHRVLNALLGVALLGAACSSFATTTLAVKGTVTPAACTPSFVGNSGAVNFGSIYASKLRTNDYTDLGSKDLTVQVSCDAPVVAALRVNGSRASSALPDAASALDNVSANRIYGLGMATAADDTEVSIGSYNIKFSKAPVVDGADAKKTLYSADKNAWKAAAGTQFLAGDGSEYYAGGSDTSVPIAALVTQFPMAVHAVANKGSLLPLQNDIKLDGAAQFELTYL